MAAFAAITPAAQAATVVPPGNSAATQYTETFPTVGGEAQVNSGIDGNTGGAKHVLGHSKTKKLESKGPDGKAVAEVTAATAPQPASQPESHESRESDESSNQGQVGAGGGSNHGGGGGQGGGSGGSKQPGKPESEAQTGPTSSSGEALTASGSSGFGEVLSQATGSSSGRLGVFLPLILIGTVACSIAYLWRRRRPVA